MNALLALTLCTLLASLLADPALEVVTSPDGSYQVKVEGATWLKSAATFFMNDGKMQTTADGSLKPYFHPETASGMDKLGSWQMVNYTYQLTDARINCMVKQYKDLPVVIFSQLMRQGSAQNTSVGDANRVLSGFPTFKVEDMSDQLGYLAYGGIMLGDTGKSIGRWGPNMKFTDGLNGGPIVLFDKNDHVLIISPFSQFMAASVWHDTGTNTVNWGIMGGVTSVPHDFQMDFIIFYGNLGINRAMSEWGGIMRKWYNKDTGLRDQDPTINYIGYYTDNGAYYYHHTEKSMNYEDTMIGVYKDFMQKQIPYKYIQYDDWWYFIKGTGYGATVTWDAMPSIFPHGLIYLYNQTNLPVVAHNRYWSSATTYAKQNGGKFNFIMDGENSLPVDQEFWNWLLGWAAKWGVIVYEQDWLNFHVENIHAMQEDIFLGRQWLMQMGQAADQHNINLQYCMAMSRHCLQSLEIPRVTQARASGDYHPGNENWRVGISSMLADAIGIAPFKDNFWTTTDQPDNIYHLSEPYPLLEAVVAVLSTGPVGISDRLGLTNTTIPKMIANADGLVLKPSKPATAIDAQIMQMAFGGSLGPQGEVWTTYSDISGYKFGVILAADLQGSYKIGPTAAGFNMEGFSAKNKVFAYKFKPNNDAPMDFSDDNPLELKGCTKQDFCLYYTAPVMQWQEMEIVILGELRGSSWTDVSQPTPSQYELPKIVPISQQRVQSIYVGDNDFQMTLKGSPGEAFFFWFHTGDWFPIPCTINKVGEAQLSFRDKSCE